MSLPYAEVIGDPIAQSRSPEIHQAWLAAAGIAADYRAVRVAPADLPRYFATRRTDPLWRGCNITIPHKQAALGHIDSLDGHGRAVGAINCVTPAGDRLEGRNTDVDGIADALAGAQVAHARVAVIGAGGAARAAISWLAKSGAAEIVVLARDQKKAAEVVALGPVTICDLADGDALTGALTIVNASPLGMVGKPAMPDALLAAVARHAAGATAFDMVYQPRETAFLTTAAAHGAQAVDGLVMLTGQARAAFRAFFGVDAPRTSPLA